MKKVAVVVPVRNEGALPKFVAEVFDSIPTGYEANAVLVVNNSTSEFEKLAETIAEGDSRIHILQLGRLGPRTFAYAYLRGLEYAVEELGANFVVEMDGNGSHEPNDLPAFVAGLENNSDAVFSTRFRQGGKIVGYPPQRWLVSAGGTILANLTLGLGQFISDMTSGFEAFNGKALRRLFEMVPPDTWISVHKGPGHFYQTEMRAYLCWLRCRISTIPIVWGAGRVENATKLPSKDLTKSLKGLWLLRKRRREFLAQLSQT